jgi:hypothetical protein
MYTYIHSYISHAYQTTTNQNQVRDQGGRAPPLLCAAQRAGGPVQALPPHLWHRHCGGRRGGGGKFSVVSFFCVRGRDGWMGGWGDHQSIHPTQSIGSTDPPQPTNQIIPPTNPATRSPHPPTNHIKNRSPLKHPKPPSQPIYPARCGTPPCGSSRSSTPSPRSTLRLSTSTPTPARKTSAAAPGWTSARVSQFSGLSGWVYVCAC